jgi:hypothetical protein
MKTCNVCKDNLPNISFPPRKGAVCQPCLNALARRRSLAAFEASVQTVDVVFPVDWGHPPSPYRLMSALSRMCQAIHGNGAVGILAKPGSLRLRLFAGDRPVWMNNKNHEWTPLRIQDLPPLVDTSIFVDGKRYRLGTPVVERLRPCRCLRVVAVQKHDRKTKKEETLRRRLLAGGVLSLVVRDGSDHKIQTGSRRSQERNYTVCTELCVFTSTERDGLVAQMVPIGPGGRYGGGICLAVPGDHDLTISKAGLLTPKEVSAELGVDHTTIQYWMRRLGYDWISRGNGRYFDESILSRLRDSIPTLRLRQDAPKSNQRWTAHELEMLRAWMDLGRSWPDLASRIGRAAKACSCKATRVRAEKTDDGIEAAFDAASQRPARPARPTLAA